MPSEARQKIWKKLDSEYLMKSAMGCDIFGLFKASAPDILPFYEHFGLIFSDNHHPSKLKVIVIIF